MPTDHILTLLIAERDRMNRAIEALEGPAKRRGRPPGTGTAAAPQASSPIRRRPARSAAQRKAQSERMKKYWAQRRKSAK